MQYKFIMDYGRNLNPTCIRKIYRMKNFSSKQPSICSCSHEMQRKENLVERKSLTNPSKTIKYRESCNLTKM